MLARVRVVIVDKTGTLTRGTAEISQIVTADGFTAADVLRYAASLDQTSGHVLAAALVQAATRQGLRLVSPTDVVETPGTGIEGSVDGHRTAVGGDDYIKARIGSDDPHRLHPAGTTAQTVAVAVDSRLAGMILLADHIRAEARSVIDALRSKGIARVVLASGDRAEVAQEVGRAMGVDEILSSVTPAQKVDAVVEARRYGPTMMVGDGVNDAPALAAADVGVAMGARGSAASSETAGAVLLVDDLAPLGVGLERALRTRKIALESAWVGLLLSGAAMIVAAFGYLPPVEGALLQEAIDVAVILNALRALR
jgi:P-type E1-E2 ATPase